MNGTDVGESESVAYVYAPLRFSRGASGSRSPDLRIAAASFGIDETDA